MEHSRSINVVFVIVMALLVGKLSARPHPDEIEDMKRTLYNACSGKYPITEEMKKDAKNGIISEDRNFKCFLKCCFEELSLIDEESGEIDGESIVSMSMDDIKPAAERTVKLCLPGKAGELDSCEVSFNFMQCAIKSEPSVAAMLPI